MGKESKNLISSENSDKLFKYFSSASVAAVDNYWKTLCMNEALLTSRVGFLIDRNAKGIVANMLNLISEEEVNEKAPDFLSNPPNMEEYIEDAVKVNHLYKTSSYILKALFMYGVYAGRSMSQTEFEAKNSLENLTKLDELERTYIEGEIEELDSIFNQTPKIAEEKDLPKLDKSSISQIQEVLFNMIESLDEPKKKEKSEEQVKIEFTELMKRFFNQPPDEKKPD